MSAASDLFNDVNNLLRSWGYPVEEQEGCWSRGNGQSWVSGIPQGHVNHHFVIPLSSPIMNGVNNVTYGDSSLAGPKANWYGGIDPSTGAKRLRFISVGPANHAGMGRSEVRDRVTRDVAPLGWVATSYSPVADNWGSGNGTYAGTEWHHPGDGTPWSDALMDLATALNAALCTKRGWSASRCFMHAEHSARKIDMSYHGTRGGFDLRDRVAARLTGAPSGDWFDECFA
jgi:hypothetical protein